mgnify:FL=1
MDRRKAIKNIGTGLGAITLTSTVTNIFESCQKSIGYSPVFLNNNDFKTISKLMELIIPSTETPGAIELKLPEFLDAYVDAVWSQERKDYFSIEWSAFKRDALKTFKKNNINQLITDDLDTLLSKYLKQGKNSSETEQNALNFANTLRDLTINAYKVNEYVGENLLAYAPIPGAFLGCVDLKKTTDGKAWSL